uniref:Uncharacterized protein n=1 Tax=Arundo donax TaxID=35708 RepID=A0A0A9G0A0_ARUDO
MKNAVLMIHLLPSPEKYQTKRKGKSITL